METIIVAVLLAAAGFFAARGMKKELSGEGCSCDKGRCPSGGCGSGRARG